MWNPASHSLYLYAIICSDTIGNKYYNKRSEFIMEITKDIKYVGVNDHDVDLFEGQYVVENGMAYNSYVVLD